MGAEAMSNVVDHLEQRKILPTKLFRDFDRDDTGTIERAELQLGLRAMGLRLSEEDLDGVMAFLDTD
eukprot:SAG31_NODE_42984_length_269_cov_0.611765_1_plen_66_part_10